MNKKQRNSLCILPKQIEGSFTDFQCFVTPGNTYYIQNKNETTRLIQYFMDCPTLLDYKKKLTYYVQEIFPKEYHKYHILRYPLENSNSFFLQQLLQAGATTKGYDVLRSFPETPLLMSIACFLQEETDPSCEECLLLLLQNGSSFSEELFGKKRILSILTKENMEKINTFILKYKEVLPTEQIHIWKQERFKALLY